MVEKESNIDDKIVSFLKGEASPEVAMEVMDWREENTLNRLHFSEMEKTFQATHFGQKFKKPNLEKAWKNIQPKKQAKVIPLQTVLWLTSIAACLAVAITLYFQSQLEDPSILQAKGDTTIEEAESLGRFIAANDQIDFRLADESKITLGANSQVILDKDFNTTSRALTLIGSARFTVQHDETKPFVVKVKDLIVEDLGTVFDIKTQNDTIKVVVLEGEVQLRKNGQILIVAAGDSAYYLINKKLIEQYSDQQQRQDKVFQFQGTKLKDVAQTLSDFYGRKIVIVDQAIENCPVTVTFKNENVFTILDILSELLDVQIKRENNQIKIYGKGCN